MALLDGARVHAGAPVAVHIQSREPTMLKYLRHQNPTLPLIQVLDIDWDQVSWAGLPNPPARVSHVNPPFLPCH